MIGKSFLSLISFCFQISFTFAWNGVGTSPPEQVLIDYNIQTIEDLIFNEEALNAYYHAHRELVSASDKVNEGIQFERESFNQIFSQLQIMAKMPQSHELKEALLRKGSLGTRFTVPIPFKSFGRTVSKFESYKNETLNKELQELRNLSSPIQSYGDISNFVTHLKLKLEQRNEFHSNMNNYWKEFENDPEVLALAAHHILRVFNLPTTQEFIQSQIPDAFLYKLWSLKNKAIEENFKIQDSEKVLGLNKVIKKLLPSIDLFLNEKSFPIFKVQQAQGETILGELSPGELLFVPPERSLHSIVAGIALKECVGGDPKHIEKVTPERWATYALQGTQFHWVFAGSIYKGFVQVTPFVYTENSKYEIYGNPILGSRELSRRVFLKDPDSNRLQEVSIYSLWLKNFTKYSMPSGWKGIIKSNSSTFHNAGVLGTVLTSFSYLLSNPFAKAEQFSLLDSKLAMNISDMAPLVRPFVSETYPHGKLWLELTASGENSVTLLNPQLDQIGDKKDLLEKILLESQNKIYEKIDSLFRSLDRQVIGNFYIQEFLGMILEISRSNPQLLSKAKSNILAQIPTMHIFQIPVLSNRFIKAISLYAEDDVRPDLFRSGKSAVIGFLEELSEFRPEIVYQTLKNIVHRPEASSFQIQKAKSVLSSKKRIFNPFIVNKCEFVFTI